MLLQLRDYFSKERRASLEQLARVFKTDKTALEPMLDIWVARGVLQVEEPQRACVKTCGGCSGDRDAVKYYQYVQLQKNE